jgi:deoxyribose-phosphate aldolase
MALRLDELAKTIDHSLLDPVATASDVDRLCAEAREHHFAAVCVLPFFVPQVAAVLRGCDVKICTVVSFPFGADTPKAKMAAAEHYVAAGADELDVVVNVPALRSGDFRVVRDELGALVRGVRVRSVNLGRGIVLVKAILECALLDDKLKRLACKIAEDAGVDFVETSTGYGTGGATVDDVELLRDCLPETIGVKASGEIETPEIAEEMISAGAGRIGTASAVAIVNGFAELRQVP